ncbi:MAG: hypothetical protein ACM3WQ_01120, partial [Chloroflexota bacterium]
HKFIEKKLAEDLPEPPATVAPEKAKAKPVKELVALTTTSSQRVGRKSIEDDSKGSSQTLFSYKKSEIKEFSLTVEKPSIEDMLLEYVIKTNGEIDMTRCSSDLKTSNEEIERALETLGTKGKIKIEVR